GVADEVGHHREGDLSLVRAPAVAVVELAEGVVVAEELPEREGGLGEGEAGQHFAVKVLWHGPVLGTRRGRSPTPRMAVSYDLDRPGKQWVPTPCVWPGLDGPCVTAEAQQVSQPAFRDLEALGQFRLGAFVGEIRLDDPNTQIHRVGFHTWPPCRGQC